MKVLHLSCALSASVDKLTNRLSLFHMLEEISARAFPAKLTSFCVSALFESEPGDEAVETYLIAIELNGTLLLSLSNRLDFSRTTRVRRVTTVDELTLPCPGTLTIALHRRSQRLANWPTLVRLDAAHAAVRPPPDAAAAPTPAASKRIVN